MTEVAREFGYFEGFVDESNIVDFEEKVFSCFSDEDIAVLEARG